MEIALEEDSDGDVVSAGAFGFNPCSIGNCSGRVRLQASHCKRHTFQSLFYWKLLWKNAYTKTEVDSLIGFNPCSIGNCSGSSFSGSLSGEIPTVSILVLLEIALEAVDAL